MAEVLAPVAVTSIISIVSGLIELGRQLKGTIDRVPGNYTESREIAAQITKSLKSFKELCQQHGAQKPPPGLRKALLSIKFDPKRAADKCDALLKADSPFGIYGDRINAWRHQDKIKTELERIQHHIVHAHQLFIATAAARIEQSEHQHHAEVTMTLRRMEAMTQGIAASTSNDVIIANKLKGSNKPKGGSDAKINNGSLKKPTGGAMKKPHVSEGKPKGHVSFQQYPKKHNQPGDAANKAIAKPKEPPTKNLNPAGNPADSVQTPKDPKKLSKTPK